MEATLGATGSIRSNASAPIPTIRVLPDITEPALLPESLQMPFEVLTFSPAKERSQAPSRIEKVGRDRRIELSAGGVVADIDDTCLEHSGHFIHDSAVGRYALATLGFLRERGLDISLSDFAQIWEKEFSKCLGISHNDVCKLICKTAWELYGDRLNCELTESTPDQFDRAVTSTFNQNFRQLMSRVSPMPGIQTILSECRNQGVLAAACTASPRNVILPALAQNDLLDWFRIPSEVTNPDGSKKIVYNKLAVVAGAVKKTPDGIFSGEDVTRAAHLIGQDPSCCVMFGDTMSDVGAARKAGIPVVVIRLSAKHDEIRTPEVEARAEEEFMRNFEKAAALNPDLRSGISVFLVHDFSQVSLAKKN